MTSTLVRLALATLALAACSRDVAPSTTASASDGEVASAVGQPKPARPRPTPPKPVHQSRHFDDDSAGRDTVLAKSKNAPVWPVPNAPAPLPGAILPAKRIVAYYGNPLSKKMGILGELPPDQMLARFDREVATWNAVDPSHPVQPALHLIAVVAQGAPGKDSTYRYRAVPALIEKVYAWAKQRNAILFLDVQIGKSTLESELAYLVPFLQRPDVHLAIDPEFAMTKGGVPGRRIGTYDASHINYSINLLANLVTRNKLPPKVLVVHRFTGPMVTNYKQIKLDPRVQVVMNMDGWGPPYGKRATWSRFIYPQPVEYTGFKLFYHNDVRGGSRMMTPSEVVKLFPSPIYIQYQ